MRGYLIKWSLAHRIQGDPNVADATGERGIGPVAEVTQRRPDAEIPRISRRVNHKAKP